MDRSIIAVIGLVGDVAVVAPPSVLVRAVGKALSRRSKSRPMILPVVTER